MMVNLAIESDLQLLLALGGCEIYKVHLQYVVNKFCFIEFIILTLLSLNETKSKLEESLRYSQVPTHFDGLPIATQQL